MYNSPAHVTTNWFPQEERPIATMAGAQMNIFGIFAGFLLPMFFVDKYEADEILTDEKKALYKSQMFNLMLFPAIFSTVITLVVLFFFREKPGVPLFAKSVTDASKQ